MPGTKFTRPPWFVKYNRVNHAIVNADGDYVAEVIRGSTEERQANAVLMAASPVLLEACKAALHQLEMARENVANVGGQDCAEAMAFDASIRQVRMAIQKTESL